MVPKPSVTLFVLLRLLVSCGKKSLSWKTRTSPAWCEPKPALIESPPTQIAHSAPQLLGGELREVCQQTQQQEHPKSQQNDAQEEDETQRSNGRRLQGHCLIQVKAKDRHFLHKHQAAKAEDEDFLRHFVTPPQHTGSEAGGFGLVFMQEKQWLYWGHGSFTFLDRGNRFIARSRRILQKRKETPTEPPYEPQHHQSREVFEGGGG